MFVDLRITPCMIPLWKDEKEVTQHRRATFTNFFTEWSDYLKPMKILLGLEHLDKFGKNTHYHYHINFEISDDVKKDTLQKWLRSREICGKAAYCLRLTAEPDDESRWWRYTLKENGIKCLTKGFTDAEYTEMELLAKDEKNRTVLKNNDDLTKLMNKNQFRDKMFNKLKELYPDIIDEKKLFSIIGKYYQSENKTPPFSKLLDVVFDFKVFMNHMTFEEYFERKYEK